MFRDTQVTKVAEALTSGGLLSGQGLNQETSPKQVGNTSWGSCYGTIMNLILMFSSGIDVLQVDKYGSTHFAKSVETRSLISTQSFEFAVNLH